MKFLSAQAVCLSRKPKQTLSFSHHKAWYSSVVMMSFMEVRVSIIFMCHWWIWPGYQTSCSTRLQCIHGVCGQVRQNGQQLWNCLQNMEVDQETVSSRNGHDHSKRIFLYTSHVAAKWLINISVKFSFANWLSICMKKVQQLVAFQRVDQIHLLPS